MLRFQKFILIIKAVFLNLWGIVPEGGHKVDILHISYLHYDS